MREERTQEEKLSDEALILALYHLTQVEAGTPEVGDRLKAMKLAFLAGHAMFSGRMKGLNCTFYRWSYGPMSSDVYAAWTRLMNAGLLAEEECISVTARGAELASAFIRDVLQSEENRPFLRVLEETARQWGRKSRSTILTSIYNMEMAPIRETRARPMKDLPMTAHLIEALDDDEAKVVLNIEPGWIETLAAALNPESVRSIERGVRDARAGRLVHGDAMWDAFESPAV